MGEYMGKIELLKMADKVAQLKNLGNTAFTSGDYHGAIKHFTEAISLDPSNHVLYSNRSGSYASLKDYANALNDAQKTVELKPDWGKGYGRLGTALFFLGRLEEAKGAYEKGLSVEPNNAQLQKGLADVEAEMSGASMGDAFANIFKSPDLFAKIATNPQLAPFLQQPDFVQSVQELQRNPNSLKNKLQDQRIMSLLGFLLGIGGDGAAEPQPEPKPAPTPAAPKQATKAPEPEPEPEPMELSDEDRNKQQASQEKDKGNEAYKKKDFANAIQHYSKAIELDPTNITFYTNRAAVHFEKGDFQECLKDCEKGVEVGREHLADFKLIAKAFARMGSCYQKLDDLENAVVYFNKSITEHRVQEVVTKLNKVKKDLEERKKQAYVDPAEAEEAKQLGNAAFQKGDFPEAVKHYSEAIKRNPTDAKLWSNRAATYTKMMEYRLGLKDCEEAIRLDPTFVKAHMRKGAIEEYMKDYTKAIQTYEDVKKLQADSKEAEEGIVRCFNLMQRGQSEQSREERAKAALQNPEVQEILADPIMRQILDQMAQNPAALQDHLRNPVVAKKIETLIQAGILQVR
eukprot:Colp12_sorted_trinity150504_noHs@23144